MSFLFMLDQQECISEFGMQGFRLVSHHGQATTFFRPIFGKGGNNHMTTRANCSHNHLNISMSVSRISQKMKHSTVMPNVESVNRKLCTSNVTFHPVHTVSMFH